MTLNIIFIVKDFVVLIFGFIMLYNTKIIRKFTPFENNLRQKLPAVRYYQLVVFTDFQVLAVNKINKISRK